MTKSELKDIINECIEEILLDESTIKFTGKYGETGRLITSKIENINITVSDSTTEDDFQYIEQDLPVIKKAYKKFLNGQFKDWLKISAKEFKDMKLYAVEYNYIKSKDKSTFEFDYEYHPVNKDGDLSKRTIPVAMKLSVSDGDVSKESFYDI